MDEIHRAKPASAKGRYVRAVTLSTTMGPGVHIDPLLARKADEELAATRLSRRRRRASGWPGRATGGLESHLSSCIRTAVDLRCTGHPVPKGPERVRLMRRSAASTCSRRAARGVYGPDLSAALGGGTMDNPRADKVAVVDEVRDRLSRVRRRGADRVPRPDRGRAGRTCAASSPPPAATTRSTRTPWSAWPWPTARRRPSSDLLTGPTAIAFVTAT